MAAITCDACRYWQETDGKAEPAVGECRRYAPPPGDGLTAMWPMTDADDWCGEYAERPRTPSARRP